MSEPSQSEIETRVEITVLQLQMQLAAMTIRAATAEQQLMAIQLREAQGRLQGMAT